jgi:hypothetical protein
MRLAKSRKMLPRMNEVEAKVVGVKNTKNNINMELEAQDAEFERLYECPEGCGRTFKREALEKHIKVCKSVFQKKAEAKNRGSSMITKPSAKEEPETNAYKTKDEQAKVWKKDSENFRKMIKGKAGGKDDQAVVEDGLPQKVCDVCSKHFTDEAYSRHRPLCESKKKYLQRGS